MKKQSTTWDHTKVCSRCGCNLHTKEEYEEGLCERCQEQYEEELYAIYEGKQIKQIKREG